MTTFIQVEALLESLDGRVLDASGFRDFPILCPGSSPLLPRKSQDVGGSSQLWNGGLRALEEALDDFPGLPFR